MIAFWLVVAWFSTVTGVDVVHRSGYAIPPAAGCHFRYVDRVWLGSALGAVPLKRSGVVLCWNETNR